MLIIPHSRASCTVLAVLLCCILLSEKCQAAATALDPPPLPPASDDSPPGLGPISWHPSLHPDGLSSFFTFGERLGLVFISQAAICSFIAVSGLLSYVTYNAIRSMYATPPRPWIFLNTHIDVYFLNLLLSDLVQATGGVMDIRWVVLADVLPGPFCTAQGIIKNIGDVGVALSTLAIAVHTTAVLVWKWKAPHNLTICFVVVGCIWTFISLENGISWALHHQSYIEDTGLWCWISDDYPKQRILFEYLWMWLTAFCNVLLYIPLFFVLRGNLIVTGRRLRWQRIAPREAWSRPERSDSAHIAMRMLWYPFAYVVVTLPMALVRWLSFDGREVPYEATIFAGVLFGLSGLINSLLYPFTRPALLPSRRRGLSASATESPAPQRTHSVPRHSVAPTMISFNIPSPNERNFTRESSVISISRDDAKFPSDVSFRSGPSTEIDDSPPLPPQSRGDDDKPITLFDMAYASRPSTSDTHGSGSHASPMNHPYARGFGGS